MILSMLSNEVVKGLALLFRYSKTFSMARFLDNREFNWTGVSTVSLLEDLSIFTNYACQAPKSPKELTRSKYAISHTSLFLGCDIANTFFIIHFQSRSNKGLFDKNSVQNAILGSNGSKSDLKRWFSGSFISLEWRSLRFWSVLRLILLKFWCK